MTEHSPRFADISSLSALNVDVTRYATFEYSVTQAIVAAAFLLDSTGWSFRVPEAQNSIW
jgi:hypothetical protein